MLFSRKSRINCINLITMVVIKVSVILAVVCVILSYIYYKHIQSSIHVTIEEKVAYELTRSIGQRKTLYRKIAVGTNANVDVVLSAVALLRALNITEEGHGIECNEITSLEVLEQCFSYYMTKGAAAEKPITSRELNNLIITASNQVTNVKHLVGGNAALIGLKLAELVPNGQVMLCGPVGPKLKTLLSERVMVPEKCQVSNDEYHMILEYQRNEQWANHRAPIATRFIMSHDISNSILSSLEAFIEETSQFQPDLVVVSGFHLMDGKNEQLCTERISVAADRFLKLPSHVPVHLELASMSYCGVVKELVNKIFPVVDSIGLNEQELVFFAKCLDAPNSHEIDVTDKKEQIGFYSDLIKWLLTRYGKHARRESRLTRIHFHCLYTHILAVLPGYWSENDASVSAGSWSAYTQACATQTADDTKAELRIPLHILTSLASKTTVRFNIDDPILRFNNDNVYFYLAPVLVCKKPLLTVGLGDAISASGLLYNVFKK